MIIRFDRKLFKYQVIVLYCKIFGVPKYEYFWYEQALKVRREDLFKEII